MKKFVFVPMVAVLALGACSEGSEILNPGTPDFELFDAAQRIHEDSVNAHVYGSFALSFTETAGTSAQWGVITSGAANFPGNPKNAGTCDNGLWINPQGKRTSGSMDRPHPHCVGLSEGTAEAVTIQVILEPISAHFATTEDRGTGQDWQRELLLGKGLGAKITGNGKHTEASGVIVAYAIDATTLSDPTPRRVGTLTFDLSQLAAQNINYFDTDCTISGVPGGPRCLDKVISASYTPLPGSAGVGEVTSNVTGYLYWSPAAAPFNY